MTTITANSTTGITLTSSSYSNPVVINPGVTISGTLNGVYGPTGAWTIVNHGSIGSPGANGVYLSGGGSVTNAASGSISGYNNGIYLSAAGSVTNAASASISGFDGIQITGGIGTVVNSGSIIGTPSTTSIGVDLRSGGSVTNQSGGTISGYTGVALNSGGSVTNAASALITGVYAGVAISGTTGTVVNLGSIADTAIGGIGINLGSGGAITNAASASITGMALGVDLSAGGTLTNAGTIVGNGGTAVVFGGTASNLLVLNPGYELSGIVIGGTSAGAINTLDLASAASAGTLSGLGNEFVYFSQVTIASGAKWHLATGNTLVSGSTLTELSGSTLTVAGTFTNDGVITLDPSTLTVANMTGTGSVTINSGSTLVAQTALAASNSIAFGGTGAYLHLDKPGSVAATVTNFALGETIDLKGVTPSTVTFNSGTLSFTGGEFPLSLAAPGTIVATTSGDGTAVTALCFGVNTMIATPSGERPVQELTVGELVLTHRGTACPIVWIGTGRLLAARGRRSAATPVIVRRHALANNVPNRDLCLTKGHALYFDDALIPVEELVNHRSILWDDHAQQVELYHIELDTHEVLIANGAPAESYRDDGNRWLFQNANPGWHLPPQAPCAPLLSEGPVVDAVWQRLLERAAAPLGVPLTEDADLHLVVDGRRVDALERRGDGTLAFRLGVKPRQVRLVSRAAVPQELGIARDPRMLGVAVRRIVLAQARRQRVIAADAEVLAEAFHAFEPGNGWRWTNGDAALPAELFAGMTGPAMLTIWLGGAMRYLDDGLRCVA